MSLRAKWYCSYWWRLELNKLYLQENVGWRNMAQFQFTVPVVNFKYQRQLNSPNLLFSFHPFFFITCFWMWHSEADLLLWITFSKRHKASIMTSTMSFPSFLYTPIWCAPVMCIFGEFQSSLKPLSFGVVIRPIWKTVWKEPHKNKVSLTGTNNRIELIISFTSAESKR